MSGRWFTALEITTPALVALGVGLLLGEVLGVHWLPAVLTAGAAGMAVVNWFQSVRLRRMLRIDEADANRRSPTALPYRPKDRT